MFVIYSAISLALPAQNVGIGTLTPAYKLDVNGSINTNSNAYLGGYLGVGTQSPAYKVTVQDGSVALYNSIDSKYWYMSYSNTGDYFYISESGASRLAIANGGNVGIGTTTPTSKLDVNGSLGANSAAIDGNLTVNNGYGVVRNGQSSSQLKYYTFTAPFTFTNFAGNTLFGPVQVNFPAAAGFTSTPRVMLGNYTYIAGTAGHLFSIIPSVYSVTSTGFQVYFFNSSTLKATMDFTVSFVCIGGG